MTTEEKAKAYDEALERAKHYLNNGECMETTKKFAEICFPELRESEDERALRIIKKRMCYDPVPISDEDRRIVENWLEKQKESLHIHETCKENANSFTDEDEKIRETLVNEIKMWDEHYKLFKHVSKEKVLAYLEKIKEEEGYEAIPVESTLEYKLGFKAGKESEKQKEQNTVVYDGDNYKSAKEKAWSNFCKKAPLIPEAKSVHDNGFSEGYQFGIHEEKPLKWTVHDEAVRKEAITCLKEWKRLIPSSSIEDYDNILYWLKEELSIHTEKKEQKPAEWSEEDEKIMQTMIKDGDLKPSEVTWLKSLPERLNLQPKQEWSEEDEDYLMDVKAAVNDYFDEGYAEELCDWLKSLPLNLKKRNENVAKLCSNEWSEEDERNFYWISTTIQERHLTPEYAQQVHKILSWLKSLRPQTKQELSIEKAIQWLDDTFYFLDNSSERGIDCEITTHDFDSLEEMYNSFRKAVGVDLQPHWKPSEEQMEALSDASVEASTFKKGDILESLYNDLKKLK